MDSRKNRAEAGKWFIRVQHNSSAAEEKSSGSNIEHHAKLKSR
jgi:hypothetical protein